jgi:hypothetical protein
MLNSPKDNYKTSTQRWKQANTCTKDNLYYLENNKIQKVQSRQTLYGGGDIRTFILITIHILIRRNTYYKILRRKTVFVPNTSKSLQTKLAAEANVAEGDFNCGADTEQSIVPDIPSRNSKTINFQKRRTQQQQKYLCWRSE